MTTFIVEQKLTAFTNQYQIYNGTDNGEKGQLISFAQQKRLAFKEQITFYTTSAKQEEVFTVKAEKAMDFHGKYNVLSKQGEALGAVRKVFGSSMLRSTWEVLDSQGTSLATVTEQSQPIAVLRRVWGFVPFLNDIPFFIKYHFVYLRPNTQEIMATYYKTTRFRDHYRLEVTDESLVDQVGWQTLVAQSVLLDALQGR